MKPFDLIHTPLAGTNLIEASAGTGKTYTIAGLFLRLITEKGLSVDQILVVTYTKAATEELKDRIRNTLLQAKDAFTKGSCEDALIDALVKEHKNPMLALRWIHTALIDFDHAAIFTIHGFCQRILHEHAFETGSLFDTELITDPENLMQEVADDFWRKHLYGSPPELVGYAIKKLSGPEYFFNLLAKVKTLDVRFIPDLAKPRLEHLEPFRKSFHRLQDLWPKSRLEVLQLLKDPALSGVVYGALKPHAAGSGICKRDLKISSMATAMDRFLGAEHPGFPLFKGFENFTGSKLDTSVKKNQDPPWHEVFDVCDECHSAACALEAEMDQSLLFLKADLFRFAAKELLNKKRTDNIQFFEDLLLLVRQALGDADSRSGKALASAVGQKYQAALIDEFQDTDSVQYDIFSRIFSSKDGVLFMIGDPKQAIYGFRGADIFSYLKAARHATHKYTLTENWRSEPALVTAVNTLFSRARAPFVFDEIPFEKGTSGRNIVAASEASAPLTMWFMCSEGDAPISKADAVNFFSEQTAREISGLLSRKKDRVAEGDIAVLVRTNRQARIIKNRLSDKGIPSVLYHTGDIFESQEAGEMERILSSISEPGNEQRLKSALVTDMMGVSGEDLAAESEKPAWWEPRLGAVREYFKVWNRRGFIRMFRLFLAQERVKERLLSFPDGQRRLTNVLHLSEILHQEEVRRKLGMTAVLKWLSEKRNAPSAKVDEHLLRLETDEHAVKLVTIHKSKGLEYPVVFCPFGWEGSTIAGEDIFFHDADDDRRLKVDLGSDNATAHNVLAQNELLAENLRLLYVAVTRAKRQCYLAWGRIKTAETSTLAYLLHEPLYPADDFKKNTAETTDIVASLKKRFSAKTQTDYLTDLKQLENDSQGSIRLVCLPIEPQEKYVSRAAKTEQLFCRKFSGKIDHAWKIASYSSLVSGGGAGYALAGEHPDRDAYPGHSRSFLISDADATDTTDILFFPKGTRAGIFFHDVFEHFDFTEKTSGALENLVESKLQEHGFAPSWKASVCRAINDVISVPLFLKRKKLSLSTVPLKDRMNELEFYFPLQPVTPHELKMIFKNSGRMNIPSGFPDRLEQLVFSPAGGFMKGYMDMVFVHEGRFYLVDWKSNFLGADIEAYDKHCLEQAMNDAYYILQYHIYTLALHQYLRRRLPSYQYERDFGGVIYIFVRGVTRTRGSEFGIYTDFPSPGLIHALGKALIP